jgi:hypothetical protein
MKKLLLSLLVLIPTTSLIADMQFDEVNKRFYSSPMTPDIDQDKYHDMWTKFIQIYKAWAAYYGVYVEDFLSRTNTEIDQIKNLLSNTAASENFEDRLKEYFEILGLEAQIYKHHDNTIARFILDLRLMYVMGQKIPQIVRDAKKK